MDIHLISGCGEHIYGIHPVKKCKAPIYRWGGAKKKQGGGLGGRADHQPQQESASVTPLWRFHLAVADKRKCRPLESTRRLSENDSGHKQTGCTPVASVKSTYANVLCGVPSLLQSVRHLYENKRRTRSTLLLLLVVGYFSRPFFFLPTPTQNTQNYTNQSFNCC